MRTMRFHVGAHLEYKAKFPSTMLLNIQAQRSPSQVIVEEQLVIEPQAKIEEFTQDITGNRFVRLETGKHKALTIN
jgi:hypothetical protein